MFDVFVAAPHLLRTRRDIMQKHNVMRLSYISKTRFFKNIMFTFFLFSRLTGNAFRRNNCSAHGGGLLFADGATSTGADRFDFTTVVVAAAIALFQRLQTERSVPTTVQRRIPATVQRRVPATVQRRGAATVRSAVLQRSKPRVQRTIRADLTAIVRSLPGG